MSITSREIRLKSRPEGTPSAANFEIASVELGAPGAGEVLVRNTLHVGRPLYARPHV